MADIDLYRKLAERHGHYCPMSTLGVRLGEEAVRVLSAFPQAEIQLCYLIKTCAAEGMRFLFESEDFNQEVQINPQGQHRLHCLLGADKELSLQFTDEAMQFAAGYRELSETEKPQRLEFLRTVAAERLIVLTEGPVS